jgi:hypothetical protein
MQSRMSGASSKQDVQQSVGAYAGSLLYRAEQKRDDDLIKIKGVRRTSFHGIAFRIWRMDHSCQR